MGNIEIEARLAAIRARANKASTGPWKVDTSEHFGNNWPITTGASSADGKVYHVCTEGVRASELNGDAKTDAEFIAAARIDIPFLLDLIEILREYPQIPGDGAPSPARGEEGNERL